MAEGDALADEGIQRYIDGRLGERERTVVAVYLRTHPAAAAEVEALRRQSEVLRQIGQEILSEPVPERLREVLRRRWYH